MESIKKQKKKAQQPVLETHVVTLVAIHERPVRKADGHAQPKPKELSQDAEDTDCAVAVFDPFVKIGFKPKRSQMTATARYATRLGEVRMKEYIGCAVKRQGLAIDRQQRQKKDRIHQENKMEVGSNVVVFHSLTEFGAICVISINSCTFQIA